MVTAQNFFQIQQAITAKKYFEILKQIVWFGNIKWF